MEQRRLTATDQQVLDERDDGELIRAAPVDPDAFAEIYRRYAHPVFWYLLTRCPSEEDAADLTQYAFLRALETLPRYEDRGVPFRAWLFRVARNAANDAYRRRRRLPWERIEADQTIQPAPEPETRVLQQEALVRLAQLLAELSADKRELLGLRFGAQLEMAEIAAVVGKSEFAVRKQLQRIIRSLREHYDDH